MWPSEPSTRPRTRWISRSAAIGLGILAVDDGRRNSETYRRYFPDGYGRVLGWRPERSLPVAQGLPAALGNETDADILARRDRLAAAAAQLETAVTAREAAAGGLGQARALLEEDHLAWRTAHETLYCTVRAQFAGRHAA